MLRVGTLSKTLGALGGFVAGPAALTDLVVNRARSYIFTTASTPADAAAALAAVAIVQGPEGDDLARPAAGQRRPAPRRATRRRSSRCSCGDEAARARRRRPRSSIAACSCRRSGRRRSRPAPRACASRSRPRTRSTRSATLRAALDELGPAR